MFKENHKLSLLSSSNDNNFHLIRILCAWAVLVAHSYVLIKIKPDIVDPFQYYFNIGMGTFFVTVFFSISGFLIYRSLQRSQDLKQYAIARIVRIFPAFLIVILLTVLLLGPALTEFKLGLYFRLSDTWSYLLNLNLLSLHTQFHLPGVFQRNPYPDSINGSIWTLPIEAWMYTLTATVFCLQYIVQYYQRISISFFNGLTFTLGSILICFFSDYSLKNEQINYYEIFLFTGCYLAGSALYEYRNRIHLSIVTSILLLIGIPIFKDSYIYPMYFSVSIAYTVLVAAYLPKGIIRRYNSMGDYSYGLYIYAFPVQQTLIHCLPNTSFTQMILYSTCISIVLAFFSWHWIEQPILRKIRRVPGTSS